MTCRVLIADDEQDMADSLGMLLQLDGHDVRVVHDGQEALVVVSSFQPDVALLDISMPNMDGYEIARRIRADSAGARMILIALTGWGQQRDKDSAREAGFDVHLVKPVDHSKLQQVLADSCPSA
jgi:CheY-like chemotaxis protein